MREAKPITAARKGATAPATPQKPSDPERNRAIESYSSALRLMQEGKFDKARAGFEKMLASSPPDLAERVRVHITACDRLGKPKDKTFETAAERYDYAVSLLNDGIYEDAREHFEALIQADKYCDFAYYGLAVLNSMTGHPEECLDNLSEAIRLNPQTRIHARGDSDLQDMQDDPRFTELLYPEIS
jgi:tetratricopeptide (TPR) repeat protein